MRSERKCGPDVLVLPAQPWFMPGNVLPDGASGLSVTQLNLKDDQKYTLPFFPTFLFNDSISATGQVGLGVVTHLLGGVGRDV